jgi:alcohol dehydrogenase class IV
MTTDDEGPVRAIVSQFRAAQRFLCPVEAFYRRGVAAELAPRLQRLGVTRPMVITDRAVAALAGGPLIAAVTAAFPAARVHFLEGEEPTDDTVAPVIDVARAASPDWLVAIGGGSVLDTTKVVAVAAAHRDAPVARFLKPSTTPIESYIPWVGVPTTAGPGAEVTRGIALHDPRRGVKRGFSSGGAYARLALLDPAMTDALPRAATATSGIDAFCQALEAWLSPGSFPIGDVLSVTALELIHRSFPGALTGGEPAARDEMMLAAYFAALSFSTGGGLTFAHEFSDVVGARCRIPHGFAAALLLPAVARIASRDQPARAAIAARTLGDPDGDLGTIVGRWLAVAGAPHVSTVLSREHCRELAAETMHQADRGGAQLVEAVLEITDVAYDLDPG